MNEIQQEFKGAPKYLQQKDSPLEIPADIVKQFFLACDQDLDDLLSIDELVTYAKKHQLPLSEDTIADMYYEITGGRVVISEKSRHTPITLDEVQAEVRGRHRWSPNTKQWEVSYRRMRDHWIVML